MKDFGVKGLKNFEEFLERLPDETTEAARIAVNAGAKVAQNQGRRMITRDVNLKENYVKKRLEVTKFANRGDDVPRAVVTGRRRPTSLARFDPIRTSKGLTVHVGDNRKALVETAWIMKLKSGNRGLAIRLKKGEEVRGRRIKYKPLYATKNTGVFLLYGPSVDQLFHTYINPEKGRHTKLLDAVEEKMQDEFERQLRRLIND